MKKQLLGLGLSFVVTVGALMPVSVQSETTEIETGEAGENVIYTYDKSTGMMIFSGSGKLVFVPQKEYDKVTNVVIEEGITELEMSLGENFHGLQELTISSTVQKVNTGDGAKVLKDNYNLRKIYNYSSVEFDPRYGGVLSVSGWNKKSDVIKNGKRGGSIPEDYSPLKWMVNGEEVTTIPPHSEATAMPREYKITYDLNGGKKDGGKWITSYFYGTAQDLPKPKRKGYYFAGWKTDGSIYFPTRAYSKIVPTQYSDVELTAIWRKVEVIKKKKKPSIQILVSPKKYPQLTVLVSTEQNVKQALKDGALGTVRRYTLAGKGIKSKTKKGMRVFHIRKFGSPKFGWAGEDFQKGRTYYIWIKYGSVQKYEYSGIDIEEDVKYITDDAYYFYKTKVQF